MNSNNKVAQLISSLKSTRLKLIRSKRRLGRQRTIDIDAHYTLAVSRLTALNF